MVIRQAKEKDVRQIAEIVIEDWQIAYRGIMDSHFLDSLSVQQEYDKDIRRYREYIVATDKDEVLGFAWNQFIDGETADCEIIALYVRYSKRKNGIGKALMQYSMDYFRESGKKTMIIWCLKDNHESRKFYEKMGGIVYKDSIHRWGDHEYDIISYLYRLDK